jgi:Icc-related predicted phosphoesterase
MIVVALADIHGIIAALEPLGPPLREADLVLLTGDLTDFGHAAGAARVVEGVRRHNEMILAVPGNCDHPDVADYLAEAGISLNGAHAVRGGVAFVGLGGSLPCPGHTPNESTEAELSRQLSEAAEGLDPALPWVLLSHQPPCNTAVDLAHGGRHVGSQSVRDFIVEHEPLACFSGHIHEAEGTDAIGPTGLLNPGPLRRGHYAYAELGERLEVMEIR